MNIEQMEELAYKEAKKYKLYTDPRFFTLPFTLGFEKALSLKNEWISVEDRLPENNNYILVLAPECAVIGNVLIGCYFKPQGKFGNSWTVYDFNEPKLDETVTHWQPLPEPPKQSK